MPLFNKRSDIPRHQFRDILKKTDIKISGRQLSGREKTNLEKIDFPKRYGSSISKSEYSRTINKLKGEKMVEQDFTKKVKLGKKVKFLEGLEKEPDTK